jgi:hypothetical protein
MRTLPLKGERDTSDGLAAAFGKLSNVGQDVRFFKIAAEGFVLGIEFDPVGHRHLTASLWLTAP